MMMIHAIIRWLFLSAADTVLVSCAAASMMMMMMMMNSVSRHLLPDHVKHGRNS